MALPNRNRLPAFLGEGHPMSQNAELPREVPAVRSQRYVDYNRQNEVLLLPPVTEKISLGGI